MRFSSVRELKFKTSEVLRRTASGEPVIITSHGKPKAILAPVEEDELEDLLLYYSPSLRKKIEQGLEDVRKGRITSLESYLAKRSKPKKR
ncbi:MAG: type II toxin-antitoxin system Phd/YefM family antitoxin [Nitrospiria bacterium]